MPSKSTTMRIGLLLALAVGWIILRSVRPEWAGLALKPWVRLSEDHGWWVPAVGGGLLVTLMTGLLWPLLFKKNRHPEDAMGLGCLMIAAWGVGAVMLALVICVTFRVYFLVNAISFVMMTMAALVLPQLIWALITNRWKRRQR
jgi:hypothetical protein